MATSWQDLATASFNSIVDHHVYVKTPYDRGFIAFNSIVDHPKQAGGGAADKQRIDFQFYSRSSD